MRKNTVLFFLASIFCIQTMSAVEKYGQMHATIVGIDKPKKSIMVRTDSGQRLTVKRTQVSNPDPLTLNQSIMVNIDLTKLKK